MPRIPGVSLRGANRRHDEGSPKKRTAEYRLWSTMRERVKRDPYLRRGITVCERWRQSYEAFLGDVGRRPSPAHSLDRIDNDRGYEPNNVRWATREQQNRNRSDNRVLTVNGETRCLMEWSEVTGLKFSTLRTRLDRGWSPEEALSRAPSKERRACRA